MKLKLRRLLVFLVVLTMVIPSGLAYAATNDGDAPQQEEVVAETTLEGEDGDVVDLDPATLNVKKLGSDLDLDAAKAEASKTSNAAVITAEELANMDNKQLKKSVRVSIFLEDPATLKKYSAKQVNNFLAKNYRAGLEKKQVKLEGRISDLIGRTLNVNWNLTLAVNAISTEMTYGEIAKIMDLKGIQSIEREKKYSALKDENTAEPNTSLTSSGMTGATNAWAQGYTGAGRKIAIVDTGIDLTHMSFDADAFDHAIAELEEEGKTVDLLTEDEIPDGLNGEGVYYSSKLPYVYNYVDGDLDVEHINDVQGEHGSHVAGIAAANRFVKVDGEFKNAAEEVYAVGMAPDAQIIVMKVFGKRGGAYDADYMAAIEDAIALGCDSCNLSLGSGEPGFTYDTSYQQVLNALSQENDGMVVSISAGNSGAWADNNSYLGEVFYEDINYHTGGSPGTFINAFTVASAENIGTTGMPLKFNEDQLVYYTEGKNDMTDAAGEHDYVYIDAKGYAEEYAAVNEKVSLKGKVVIVNRGTISFFEKGNFLIEYEPAALVVANNQPGTIGMALDDFVGEFPMVSITQDDGNGIKEGSTGSGVVENVDVLPYVDGDEEVDPAPADVTYYTGKVEVTSKVSTNVTNDLESTEMSTFSSWGAPASLIMKPEITAPGGNIYSVAGTNKTKNGTMAGGSDKYELMSGTSMAAPHIAGLSAVLLQYINESGAENFNNELVKNYSNRAIAQSLLMSTAVPMQPYAEDGYKGYLSVLQQGAGLADVSAAINAGSVVMMDEASLTTKTGAAEDGKVKVELGDDPEKTGEYSYTFSIYNTKDVDEEFELSTDIFTQDIDTRYGNYGFYLLSPYTADLDADVSYTWNAYGSIDEHDVDMDGDTDKDDAQAILAYITGEKAEDEVDLTKADMDEDEAITTYDAQLLLTWKPEGLESTYVVPAKGKAEVTVNVKVTDGYLDYYPNGAYIEGYTNVECVTKTDEGEDLGHKHTIPVLGFYGNWTDASMFDYMSYYDGAELQFDGDDPDDYTDLYTYSGNWETNYMTIKHDGEELPFVGNPYTIEKEGFPYDRLAISSKTEIKDFYYNTIRAAATMGTAVSSLDENHNIKEVLEATPSEYLYAGLWYDDNEAEQMNTKTKVTSLNKAVKDYGFEEGDLFRAGFYAIPEYYGMKINGSYDANDITSWYSGLLYQDGEFQEAIESGLLGDGAYIGYDLTVDDTAPVIDKASVAYDADAGTVSLKATDNMNIAYVALMDVNGNMVFAEEVPAGPEFDGTLDASLAAEYAEGYVAVFVGDYAGNEAAVALKVNDEPAPDPLAVASVTVSPKTVNIFKGESKDVNVKVTPITAENKDVKWVSEDENIAVVSENGTITGTGAGTTTIKAVSASNEEIFGECTVNVLYIEKDMKSILWDEEGAIWFTDFNTGKLPAYDKKVQSEVPSLMTAFNYFGYVIGGSMDTSAGATSLYLVDPDNDYATEALGKNRYWANDTAIGAVEYGTDLAYAYGNAIVLGNLLPQEYSGAEYTGLPYVIGDFSETLGDSYIAGLAYAGDLSKKLDEETKEELIYEYAYYNSQDGMDEDEAFETAIAQVSEDFPEDNYNLPAYYFLDEEGNIWYTETYYGISDYGFDVLFDEAKLITETGIKTNFLYQSLYFDGEYLYWSHYDDGDYAYLYVIDPETGDLYTAGDFGAKVWPVSGLYEYESPESADGNKLADRAVVPGALRSVNTKFMESDREAVEERYAEALKAIEAKMPAEEPEEETAEEPAEEPAPQADETAVEEPEAVEEAEAVAEPEVVEEEAQTEEIAEPETVDEEDADGSLNAVKNGNGAPATKTIPQLKSINATGDAAGSLKAAKSNEVTFDITETLKSTNGLIAVVYDPEALVYEGCTPNLGCTSVMNYEDYGVVYFAYANETAVKAKSKLATVTFKAPCEDTYGQTITLERNKRFNIEEENDTFTVKGIGHDYELTEWTWAEDYSTATATFTCANDPAHVEEVKGEVTSEITDPTCENAGKTVYTATAVFEDETYTDTKETPLDAIGHKWGEPAWTWADDYSTATAEFTCANDPAHVEKVKASVTHKSTESVCEKGGEVVHTATATFEDKDYTDSKTETVEATGHRYGKPTYTWSDDNKTVTAEMICRNDDSHVVTETVEVKVETTKEATCKEEGEATYTATFTNEAFETQTKTEVLEATGHKYGSYKLGRAATTRKSGKLVKTCENCGKEITKVVSPMVAKAKVLSGSIAKFTWKKVKGAGRYQVYLVSCGVKKSPKKIATTTNLTYVKTKLKKATCYKFKIVAQRKIDGKWTNISTSHVNHFVSGNLTRTKNYTNAKSIIASKKAVTLTVGKATTIKAKATGVKANKKLLSKTHASLYRFLSTNTDVAKVSAKGKITAVGKGTCTVYAIAVNGLWKAVKVTVK